VTDRAGTGCRAAWCWPPVVLVVVAMLGACGRVPWAAAPTSVPPTPTVTPGRTPTRTPEPIVPTRTPTGTATPTPAAATRTATATARPTLTATVTVTATVIATVGVDVTPTLEEEPTDTPVAAEVTPTEPVAAAPPTVAPPIVVPVTGGYVIPAEERFRLGVSLPTWHGNPNVLGALQVGWVMDWRSRDTNPYGGGVSHLQTVRLMHDQLSVDAGTLTAMAAARPGSTWMISNEPDVRWQDDVTPETYAHLYRAAHQAIKDGDGSAVVAAGGIAQPSALRLTYLDRALAEYQRTFGEPLPADAWHIHNYMLREERDSWGVDIPAGITQDTGVLYEIADSGNLETFKAQIVTFRRWMADRGYRGQPLLVSEFGIPMPADYGFAPDVVVSFLRETTRYFLTATDPSLGDPTDGGRLVQRWCWFSLEFADYPTGDLLDSEANRWTTLGYAWLDMVKD